MIDPSLLQDFITETTEHLEEIENNLLHLEKSPENFELINGIFRSVHTIKGSAEYLGMQKISKLTHNLESLMDRIRNGELNINSEIIDILISSGDVVSRLIDNLINEEGELTSIDGPLEQIVLLLENGGNVDSEQSSQSVPEPDLPHNDEEYDEELYVIFVQNLREGLTEFIQALLKLESDENPLTVLNDCISLIDHLVGSAHYMGYDQLCSLYSDLTADIKALHEDFSNPANQPVLVNAAEKIENRITKICELFDIDKVDIGLAKKMFENNPSYVDFPDEDSFELEIDRSLLEDDSQDVAVKLDDFNHESPKAIEKAYEEDYDSELFDIFIEQLVENFEWYQNDLKEIEVVAASNRTLQDTVKRWKKKLESLQSSANYMGYDRLTAIYSDWENHLEDIIDSRSGEKNTDWKKQLQVSVSRALKNVSYLFPKIGQLKEICKEASPVLPEIEKFFSDTESCDEFQLIPDHSSLLSDALQNKISKMPIHAETPHEIVSDYLFTDNASFEQTIPVHQKPTVAPVAGKENRSVLEDATAKDNASNASKNIPENNPLIQEKPINGLETEFSQVPDKNDADVIQTADVEKESISVEENTTTFLKKIQSQSIRVDANKIDVLMNQVGELVVSRAGFSQLHHEMRNLKQRLSKEERIDKRLSKQISQMTLRLYEATSSLGRAANELQEGVMRIRMLPVARLFNRYPRLIHDLVRDGDKKVDLEIRGEDTELDKMVIEKISDPMIHIIRNAIDHGIENSADRKNAGKPEMAKLIIEAYHESNHVVIEVTDDGRGIDPKNIKEKVLEKKLMDPVELDRLMDRDILSLITKPGFSTTDKITHTSGRGVGMDVVKKNIEKLNGTVEIDSISGKETRIRMKIPLTLAIIPALLVGVETELFTIPLSTVEETIKVNVKDMESIEGNEVIYLRNQTIPLIRLNRVFNMSETNADSKTVFIVIVSNGMNQMGLVVDTMLGQEEVVIKPLEDYLQERSGFSGATILGDGRISLILDIYDLLNISIAKMEHRRKRSAVAIG